MSHLAGTASSPAGDATIACQPLVDSIKGFFNNVEYSDLTIKCGDSTWHAHKLVLCGRCDFFKKAANGLFKEGRTGTIELVEDDPGVVHEMLRYFYTADYSDLTKDNFRLFGNTSDSAIDPLVFNVHIATIADKYNIPQLGQLATAKYKKRAAQEWKTDGFAESIEAMYESGVETKKAMHDFAIELAVKHCKELMKPGTKFREVTKTVNSFADEVLARVASGGDPAANETPAIPKIYRCSNAACGQLFTVNQASTLTHGYIICSTCSCSYSLDDLPSMEVRRA